MRVQFFLLIESVLYLARREQSEMNQKFAERNSPAMFHQ